MVSDAVFNTGLNQPLYLGWPTGWQTDPVWLWQTAGLYQLRLVDWSRQHRWRVLSNLAITLAVLSLFVGGRQVQADMQTNRHANYQAQQLIHQAQQTHNYQAAPVAPTPQPAVVNSYSVPASHPRYLDIPELGIHARVLDVGLTSSGAIETPNNIADTAWYNQSSLPGQPGATLIDGHVSTSQNPGVFYGLKRLAVGDRFQLELGNGRVLTYQIAARQVYDVASIDMNAVLSPFTPGTSALNLITCTGSVAPGTFEFNQRIVIFSELVSS